MKKLFYSLCAGLLLAGASQASAATAFKSVILNLHSDANPVAITMENDMTTTIVDGNLVLSCAKGDIMYPITDVAGWKFSTEEGLGDQWAGIENVAADDATDIFFNGSSIQFANLPADSRVEIFTIDGRSLKSLRASGTCSVDLSGLAKGVYIVNYNQKSIKIVLGR